jgi:hypothetical protein
MESIVVYTPRRIKNPIALRYSKIKKSYPISPRLSNLGGLLLKPLELRGEDPHRWLVAEGTMQY